MAKNIQAHIRYKAINKCLTRINKRWTWKAIAKECGNALRARQTDARNPSRRTLFYDFDNMRSGDLGYHAPIVCVDRKYYIYEDPNFNIEKIPLSPKDFADLYELLRLMKSHQRIPLTDELSTIINQLSKAAKNKFNSNDNRLLVAFDQIPDAPGHQWMHSLYQMIQKKATIWVSYQSFTKKKPKRLTISPYLLKEYNKRWFLIGYNHKTKEVYTLPLDRILDLDADLLTTFYLYPPFHPQNWYKNIVGVTREQGKEAVLIRIKASPLRAAYLNTKPLHHSQKEVFRTDTEVHFTLFLIPNYELQSQFLAMADEIEVLEPLSLRKKIACKLASATQQYS